MKDPSFTDNAADHLANRQRPHVVPQHLHDQVDAAILNGARIVDAVASAGRESGTLVKRSYASPNVFDRIGERYGDPLTELRECAHLAATPIQPRYVYGGTPDRVLCGQCFAVLPDPSNETDPGNDASSNCDACGTKAQAADLHYGNLSNGIVTYIWVKLCSDCISPSP